MINAGSGIGRSPMNDITSPFRTPPPVTGLLMVTVVPVKVVTVVPAGITLGVVMSRTVCPFSTPAGVVAKCKTLPEDVAAFVLPDVLGLGPPSKKFGASCAVVVKLQAARSIGRRQRSANRVSDGPDGDGPSTVVTVTMTVRCWWP